MAEFFEDYLQGYIKEHTLQFCLLVALFLSLAAVGVGVLFFDWDLVAMWHTAKDSFSNWLYGPLDRSFDDLKGYVQQWSE